MVAVLIARRSSEVWTTSGRIPASRSCSPPRTASSRPRSERATSTQPVKRFSAFQTLSPWRSRTRVWVMSARGGGRTLGGRLGRRWGGGVQPLPLAVVVHDRDAHARGLAVVELEREVDELPGREGAVDRDAALGGEALQGIGREGERGCRDLTDGGVVTGDALQAHGVGRAVVDE